MTYGIHKWIYAGHKFASTGRYHSSAWGQETAISKGSNQGHNAVWCPGYEKQKTYCYCRLGNAYLGCVLALVHIGAQRFHIHLLGLIPQRFLVTENMSHYLAVVINYHQCGAHKAEEEYGAHKQTRIEVIGEIIKGARCQITLGYKAIPELCQRQHNPWSAVEPDDDIHDDGLGKGHISIHWLGDHIETIISNGCIGHSRSDARIRTNGSEDLASRVAQGEATMEAVVDEDGRLEAHDEVEDSQIQHKHIGWCAQRFRSAENPDNHSIANGRGAEEKDIEDA